VDSPRRDLTRALGTGFLLAAAVLLVITLRVPGIMLAIVLVAVMYAVLHRYDTDPEASALTSSLRIVRDDIGDILARYDTFLHGPDPDAIAERTLYYPALADPGTTHPAIQDFQLRAAAARRFIARVDARLAQGDLDRAQLEHLITIADERAFALDTAWRDARRAARELGPA